MHNGGKREVFFSKCHTHSQKVRRPGRHKEGPWGDEGWQAESKSKKKKWGRAKYLKGVRRERNDEVLANGAR